MGLSIATSPRPWGAIRLLLALAAWYLALSAVLRVALWAVFGTASQVPASALAWILPAGALADGIQAMYLFAPLVALVCLVPARWHGTPAMRRLLLGAAFAGMFLLLFVAACEYFFFEEFDARFNLVSVDYLIYPTEVAGDIWAEYPVLPLLFAAAALAAASTFALRRWITPEPGWTGGAAHRGGVLLSLAAMLTLTGMLAADDFRPSGNRVANELAANGAAGFFRALRTSEIDYEAYYRTRDPVANLSLLRDQFAATGGRLSRTAEGRIDRVFPGRADGLGKLNVVLVTSESFGAEFSRLYGSERDWTPEFDRLAQQGIWFSNAYASGTRTVRGLEAVTTSLPPIPTVSILRRPGHEDVATLGKVLGRQGYATEFLYGGYGYFDNMNEFFASNGYTVFDRTAIAGEPRFENIWGVADEDLFDLALSRADSLAATGQPFLLHVMTTSNHKPFTFRTGLEHLGIKPEGGGRESGVRYADYAQGYFLREAGKRDWYRNTVFVILADHGARVYGRQEIPLATYRIPMLILAPGHLAPARHDGLTTQLDVAPTLLGLLGLPYEAPWFGRDVLHTPEAGRVAFFSHNHDVAMLRDDQLVILGLGKSVTHQRYIAASDSYRVDRNVGRDLDDLATAYYQTAYELFQSHRYN